MKKIVREFVKLQIDHSKKVQRVWEEVLPSLQQLGPQAGSGNANGNAGNRNISESDVDGLEQSEL